MSYILDALRRAEAERRRGTVPDLNTPDGLALPPDDGEPLEERRRWPQWLALGAALLAVAALAWWWGQRSAQVRAVSTLAVAVPQPTASATPPAAPAAVAQAPAALPSVPPTLATPPAPAAAPARVAAKGVAPTPAPTSAATPPSPPPVKTSPPAAPAERPSARLPSLAELPEAVRTQLPPMALGGGMFSDQPAQRLVLLNGQVVREGDQPAAGLKLMQIRRRSVVFDFQGQRFEVPL